ncbi:MAG: hypothetical protein ACIPMY_07165 [Rickettsia endosymbiont of Pentastiridius leporinus]
MVREHSRSYKDDVANFSNSASIFFIASRCIALTRQSSQKI